jgi:flavin-dependent dehydrogenase
VGVGVDPKIDAKKALHFFMNHYPKINKILGKKYSISETIAGAVPSNGPKPASELVGDGVLLVGDSAGIVEPITGEGITSSILSGISAGEVISNCLKRGVKDKKNLDVYDKTWRSKKYMGSTLGKEMDLLIEMKKSLDYNDKNWSKKIVSGLEIA